MTISSCVCGLLVLTGGDDDSEPELDYFEKIVEEGKSLLIFICNFHVLSSFLLIYICELHWKLSHVLTRTTAVTYRLRSLFFGKLLLIYI